jgi:hypothetical protein
MGSKFILHLKLFRLIWDSEKYKICKVNVLTRNFVHRRFILFFGKGMHTEWYIQSLRENRNSPSARNFPESQKSGTRGSQSSPSVALGEDKHSGKRAFPECREGHGTQGKFGTRGKSSSPRGTLGEGGHSQNEFRIWRRRWTEQFAKKWKTSSPSASYKHSGRDLFPECLVPRTRGRDFYLFVFLPHFFEAFPHYFNSLPKFDLLLNFFVIFC